MKSNFTLLLLVLISLTSKAQITGLKNFEAIPVNPVHVSENSGGECDTLRGTEANNWSAYYYKYLGGGTIFGTGNLLSAQRKVMETAGAFDVTGSSYKYVTGGLVYFAIANSNTATELTKTIVFKLYADAGGFPGALIDSAVLTLAQVNQSVAAGKLTEFRFAAPVAIDASQKFYISVDHRKFRWAPNVKDSIAIVATGDDVTTNTAYQYINEGRSGKKWYAVKDFWKDSTNGLALDVSLFIFPFVSVEQGSCPLILPVTMFNFGGTIKDNSAYLNWSTAAESNNKGFDVERSKNGKDFSSVGFVNGAGNTTNITNYSFVDASLKDINVNTTYYRLKQVDVDGKFEYSKVLALNTESIDASKWKIFPNPVKDVATVQVRLDAAAKVSAQLISRDGKVLLSVDKGVLTEGLQQFYINTQGIAKGSYVVRINVGDKNYAGVIMKD